MTSPRRVVTMQAVPRDLDRPGWIGQPAVQPGAPWSWALACLLLGWGAGSLFRLRALLGINVLDMFGFWCLVGAGLCAAQFFTAMQVVDGRRRLFEALERLSGGFVKVAIPGAAHRGRGGAEVLVATADRAWVIGTLDVSASARPKAARKRLVAAADRLVAESRILSAELAAAGVRWPAEPAPVLVLTRRPVHGPLLEYGVWQVNPEHLVKLLDERSAATRVRGSLQAALAAWHERRALQAQHRRRR